MKNFDTKLLDNSVVVAPRELHDYFLSLKNDNPLLDFSIMTLEEVVSLFSYQYDDRAVEAIVSTGCKYRKALKMLEVFSFPKAEEVISQDEKAIRDTLIRSCLLYLNEYPELTFKGKNCIVAGYKQKSFLNKYIKDIGCLDIIYLDDETNENRCRNLLVFKDIYEEVHYLFNEIAEDLSSGTNINDIFVVGANADYDILFKEFSRHYGFEIENGSSLGLYYSSTFKRFAILSSEVGVEEAFKSLIEEGYPTEDIEAIEKIALRWSGVTGSEETDLVLFADIASCKMSYSPTLSNIVRKLNSFIAPPNSHVYMVNFAMGTYPPVYDEDSYITDEKCEKLGLMTSQERSVEAKEELLSLMNSPNVNLVSFSSKAFGSTSFASALISTLGLNKIQSPISRVEYADDKGLIALSALKDKYDNYLIVDKRLRSWENEVKDDGYKSFDYTFKHFDFDPSTLKRRYSASSIKNYSKCPFAYYLSNVLNISTFETSFNSLYGSIYHEFLSTSYYDPNFDEDVSWQRAIESVSSSEGYEFDALEKELLEIIHDYAKKALSFIKRNESEMEHFDALTESSFAIPLENDSPITITGRYDKVIKFGPEQNYYCIIDYKTGAERFDQHLFQYGLSIQLPFYAMYAKNHKSFEEKELLGLFISPLLNVPTYHTEKNKTYEEEVNNSFKLDGVFLADVSKMRSISKNDKSDFIVGLTVKRDGSFDDRSKEPGMGRIKTADQLNAMADKAKEIVKNADENIRKGNFDIKPIQVGKDFSACDGCEFRSICFRKEEAINRVPRVIEGNNREDSEEETPYGMD